MSACEQGNCETHANCSLAKLNILARCPVTLTNKQRVKCIIRSTRDKQVVTAIVTQCLETIEAFLKIAPELNRMLDYVCMQPVNSKCEALSLTMPSTKSHASLETPQQSASASPASIATRLQTAQNLSMLSPEWDAQYNDIGTRHRALAFRPGQNIAMTKTWPSVTIATV